MSFPEFIFALVSINLSFGVSKLTTGISEMIKYRKRIEFYPLHCIMIGLVFLLQVQFWWASFWDKDTIENWNFWTLAFFQITPLLYCVGSNLLTPSDQEIKAGRINYDSDSSSSSLISENQKSRKSKMSCKDYYWQHNRSLCRIAIAAEINKIWVDFMCYGITPETLQHDCYRLAAIAVILLMIKEQRENSQPKSHQEIHNPRTKYRSYKHTRIQKIRAKVSQYLTPEIIHYICCILLSLMLIFFISSYTWNLPESKTLIMDL